MREVLGLLGLSVFILCCSPLIPRAELKVGKPAPQFKSTNQENRAVDLNNLRGKWVVLYLRQDLSVFNIRVADF